MVYTVRPEMLALLVRGQEYRILVGVRRLAAAGVDFREYGVLYERARAIARLRVAARQAAEELHTRVLFHGWRAIEAFDRHFIFVFITTGVTNGGATLEGERPPTAEELTIPGGASIELLREQAKNRVSEIYIDFDHGATDDGHFLFSYGEHVPSAEGVDFAPFIQRAEALARHHYGPGLHVECHECFGPTHPDMAVVHVFFRT